MRDPTRCLEPWDWIFTRGSYGNIYWSKTFTLPYPLLVEQDGWLYLQQEVIVWLGFSGYCVDLRIKPYPDSVSITYLYSYCGTYPPKSAVSLIFQRLAIELPKIIASAKTEPFYDKVKQKQIEIIPILELEAKINQVFKKIYKAVLATRIRT